MVDESIPFSSWSVALFATAAAGAIFGFTEGEVAGFIVGGIMAAFYGVPILLSFAVITWAFWLSRFMPIMASMAGALTGILSTIMIWDTIFATDFRTAVILAACFGGVIPGVATAYYHRWRKQRHPNAAEFNRCVWQFSLSDMFWRFTVLAVLIAIWAFGLSKLR
jgi:hypothetical protein